MVTQHKRHKVTNIFVYKGGNQKVPKNVELVRIDPSVKVVEKHAFENCGKLKYVFFCEGLQEIRSSAFSSCWMLESVRLPSSMKMIGKHAFYRCNELKYVILNEGLENIEEYAFGCCGMELVCIPSTVKCVRTDSFYSCIALKRVALREGGSKVEQLAFPWCDKLETIEIPSLNLPIFEEDPFTEKTTVVAIKDLQFWNEVQCRYKQKDIGRMEKYGMMSLTSTSKPSPQVDESSRPMKKKPRTVL